MDRTPLDSPPPPPRTPPAGNRLKGGGGGGYPPLPSPTALTLPQTHSHTPTPAPTAFPTASNRPPPNRFHIPCARSATALGLPRWPPLPFKQSPLPPSHRLVIPPPCPIAAGAAVRLPSYQSLHPLEAVKLAGDLPPELCFLSVQLDLPDGQTAVLSVKTACAARPAMRTLRPARGSHMPSGLPLYGAQEMLKVARAVVGVWAQGCATVQGAGSQETVRPSWLAVTSDPPKVVEDAPTAVR